MPDNPRFWTIWHALGLAIVLAVPAYYQWGESVASVPLTWMPHVLAMGAAYLGLATVVALVRPERTLRGMLDVVVAGASVYGAALVLLSFRPDIPAAPPVAALSMFLAVSLALLPIVLQRRRAYGFVIHAVLVLGISWLGGVRSSLAGSRCKWCSATRGR